MKKVELQVLKENGDLVRKYHLNYDDSEGDVFLLTVGDRKYNINKRGELKPAVGTNPETGFYLFDDDNNGHNENNKT